MAGSLTRRNFLSFDFGDRPRDPDHWVRIHRIAMACRFEVMLSSDDAGDVAAARSALDEADDIEALLTVFRENSVVSDLNRRGSREDVTVGAGLFSLLALCRELHERTGGAFDVTSTPLVRCWDTLEREGRLPPDAGIAGACASVDMGHVHVDAANRCVRFPRAGLAPTFCAIGAAAPAARLSTAFVIGGPELAGRYCDAHSDVLTVLVLDEPGERTEVFGRYGGATLEMLTAS